MEVKEMEGSLFHSGWWPLSDLTDHHNMLWNKRKCQEKELELNSINCAAAELFKVLMVNHGFYNGKKVNDLKNAILGKISVQISPYYTQIEDNSNI